MRDETLTGETAQRLAVLVVDQGGTVGGSAGGGGTATGLTRVHGQGPPGWAMAVVDQDETSIVPLMWLWIPQK